MKEICSNIYGRAAWSLLAASMIFGWTGSVFASESFAGALTGGKPSLDIRYRFEWVDQEGLARDANANTLRTRVGFRTGNYHGWAAYLEFEGVASIASERFNDTKNGKTRYPVVADPADDEINQAYLEWGGLDKTRLVIGRQRIILDNARFVGNVGWRQNEQTFDAVSVLNESLPHTKAFYAFARDADRIFGAHHPTMSDAPMKTHLINLRYDGFAPLPVTAYGYLVDFDDTPAASTKTFGVRAGGSQPVSESVRVLYSGEFASQSEFSDGLSTNDARYFLGELGGGFLGFQVKAGYEVLGGDGVYGFATPLATLHAFQGWTDKFLATPADGIRDLYVIAGASVYGVKIALAYHDFSSDHDGYDYGTELGSMAMRTFAQYYTFGVKYAAYRAAVNSDNSGPTAVDTDKLWLTAQLKF